MLVLAASYWLSAKLGLLLAIPSGYATAVWPPSGIALGCLLLWGVRYWPGILLGSLLTNLTTSYDGSSVETMIRSCFVATSIGAGAAAQAVVAALLLRRFVAQPLAFIRERDVLRFFIVGGPGAHLMNATWSTATIVLSGVVPATAFAQSWWTWWVGDSIGAMIFAPLTIMWLSTDASWSTRRTLVTVPLTATFLAAIFVFVYTRQSEQHQLQQRFNADATEIAHAIGRRADLSIEALQSIGRMIEVRPDVDHSVFRRFTSPALTRHEEILAIEWVPRVTSAQRDAFEHELRAAFGGSREVFEHRERGFISAATREEYFPIRFTAQIAADVDMTGFDLASEPRRREALTAARRRKEIAASAPVDLLQKSGLGILLVQPVHAAERHEFLGYVTAVLPIKDLMAAALQDKPLASVHLHAADIDPISQALTAAYDSAPVASHTPTNEAPEQGRLAQAVDVRVADRTWRLNFQSSGADLERRQTPGAWLALAGGMLFTALIAAGALLVTGRAQAIEILVGRRTTEMAQINEKLADEICDHLNTEHALATERELLQTVLDNLHEGILVLDADGALRMANGAAHGMLQRITGDEYGKLSRPRSFRLFAADGTTELLQAQTPHWRALHGDTVRDFEVIAQRDGRAPMTLLVNAQPLLGGDNRRQGAILVMRDITDSKQVEKLKSEFVATVSHELRTPITSIRGSLGLIVGGAAGVLSDKARNLAEIALRNSDRLGMLINDLLDIEKMESGNMQFDLRPQPLDTLIEQAVEANQGYAQNLNVRFAIQRPLPAALVNVDSFRLLQVMSNLLSNAAKFSPPQSTVTIAAEVLESSGIRRARVRVTDRGPGIPEEFRTRIFQKFSQADSSDRRAQSGTGLGLAICRNIMDQMHGRIDYETETGRGSTFYFELPLADEDSMAATG